MRFFHLSLTLTLVILVCGCAEEYVPRTPHRVAVVDGGVYRDGKRYALGWFGGDVGQAVVGDARAEQEMSRAEQTHSVGEVFLLGSLGLLVGSSVVAVDDRTAAQSQSMSVVSGLLLGGAVAEIVAVVVLGRQHAPGERGEYV
jgi:hypothetical protein